MTEKHSKLQHRQQQEQAAELRQETAQQSARDFESVEQMLQEDALKTRVPESVEQRLSESVRENPQPRQSWWNRWRKK